jgi:hypothetical protein
MSYTVAKSLGFETRDLSELIPAEKLDMLEPIMAEWASKIYETFDGDIDKEKIGEHIRWIYATHKYQSPKVIYIYNPDMYKSLVASLLLHEKDTPVEINMKDYLSGVVKAPVWLTVNTDREVNKIERFQTTFRNIIARLPFKNMKGFLRYISPDDDMWRAMFDKSISPHIIPAWLANRQLEEMFSGAGLWNDCAWFFLFDFLSATGIRKNELIDKYRDFLNSGVLASMFFEKNAVVIIQPQFTKMTANRQFHCDGGAAIEWKDGYKSYLLHNVVVPEELVLTPHHQLDPMSVLTERNAEVRREIVRKMGVERLVSHFGGVVLDKYQDYELIELTLKDIDLTARYLKMKNPSIGTWHVEGVPPDIETCLDALKWRLGGLDWNPQQLT